MKTHYIRIQTKKISLFSLLDKDPNQEDLSLLIVEDSLDKETNQDQVAMFEDEVMSHNNDEVTTKQRGVYKSNFDLNKLPDENGAFLLAMTFTTSFPNSSSCGGKTFKSSGALFSFNIDTSSMASKSLYGSFKSVGCGDLFSFSINTS
ncbi:hypothetical protein QL285_033370 [Trifolium repens]|jgi:hypothetical protein|nr:hypothetical protein QL285_033370 [Trifolium repens]